MSLSRSTAERRFLRVGIMHGGRIVEERVLSQLDDVTVGTSPRSTFIVPWDEVPRRWRLFEARGGRRVLHLAENMAARIADGVAVTRVDARGGEATATQPIPLADRARGKVTFGDTTVLFQLLRPPASRPRPQLPPSIRRRLMAEVDRWFALCLALTALLHVVVVVYLRQVDWPRRPSIEEIPDRFIHQMVRAPRARADGGRRARVRTAASPAPGRLDAGAAARACPARRASRSRLRSGAWASFRC